MQELEKILEEIDREVEEYMKIDFGDEYNAGFKDMAYMAKKIIRKMLLPLSKNGQQSIRQRGGRTNYLRYFQMRKLKTELLLHAPNH